jgi:diketogulonate reductase-like aldo/keto reductase
MYKKEFTICNGHKIPTTGLGTWLISNDQIYDAFNLAIKAGYTHFDSAQGYGNEENLGRALNDSGLPRESLFITSKVLAEHKTYESARASIEESLRKLATPYIDLMLIHCPTPWDEYPHSEGKYDDGNREVWKALEEFYLEGKIKAIGVSNFSIRDIENILKDCKIKPMVNQIPLYIGCTNIPLIKYCQENDILIEAYSPIAHGRALTNPLIKEYADKYNCSISELCLAYTLQLDTVTLPKTLNYDHMVENLNVKVEISKEDMEKLMLIEE